MSRRVVVKLPPATCQRLAIELGTEDLDVLVRVALENMLTQYANRHRDRVSAARMEQAQRRYQAMIRTARFKFPLTVAWEDKVRRLARGKQSFG